MLVYVEHVLSMAGIRLYDEDGQGLIEYVLIAALISIAAIAAIRIVGPAVSTQFDTVGTELTTP
ncbi:MAG: Flp family type IVb pilin [Thermomicrobiales bacterium]